MADIDAIAARISTNLEGRAALGIAASWLRKGYEAVEDIEPDLATTLLAPAYALGLEIIDGDVREDALLMLNGANSLAQIVYRSLPDNQDPIDGDKHGQVVSALVRADRALRIVQGARRDLALGFLGELTEVYRGAAMVAEEGLTALKNAASKITDALIPTWLKWTLGGVLAVGLVVLVLRVTPK